MGGTKLHVRQSVDFTDVGFLPDRSDGQSNQTARIPRDFHDVFVRGKHRCHYVYLHHGFVRQLPIFDWKTFPGTFDQSRWKWGPRVWILD